MIIYSGTLGQFSDDVFHGIIADRIEECFKEHGFMHNNEAEHRAFNNSLMVMNNVLCNNSGIDQDCQVAIEYQIPLTSKRVDFLISGYDEKFILVSCALISNCRFNEMAQAVELMMIS